MQGFAPPEGAMSEDFSKIRASLPNLGVGLGLRRELHDETLQATSDIHWLEFTPEEFMGSNGSSRQRLEDAASRFPLISHGINLSLGSTDDLNPGYLAELKNLLDKFNVAWWSDHISFSSANGVYVNNLLPLPRNSETVKHLVKRIRQAQDYMQRPILVENISFYMPNPPASPLSEAEFISEILEQADCGMLLDLNNVFVNSINHKFDPFDFLNHIPLDRVIQVHLAGHNYHEEMVIDTHSEAVCDPVYELLDRLLQKVLPKGIMIERDGNFPEFAEMLAELRRVQAIVDKYKNRHEVHPEATSEVISVSTPAPEKKKKTKKAKPEKINLASLESVFSNVVTDKVSRRKVISCLDYGCDKNCPGECTGGFKKRHSDDLDLYARITEAGMLSAMKLMYPVTQRLLDEKWDDLIEAYFHKYAPTGYVLAFLGEKFAEFLSSVQDELPLPFTSQMADFEWHRIYSSEAGSYCTEEVVAPDFSRQTDPSTRMPLLNPTLILRDYDFAITEIYDQLVYSDATQVEFGEPECVAFYRKQRDHHVIIYSMEESLSKIVKLLPHCSSYADLFQKLIAQDGATQPIQQIIEYANSLQKLYDWDIISGDLLVKKAQDQKSRNHLVMG